MDNQIAIFIDFENIALWAEREFFDFELTPIMEYLQTRGPAVVKRAYGDWSRFMRYRDELMNFSIDLFQIYSLRAGKNRADIRMAIDALEIAITRPQVQTFVIISGDSDFGPLVAKLREYGRYTLGVGPRSITHHLLVKSCDEFVYLETILGGAADAEGSSSTEKEEARSTLRKALQAHGQRGELPVLAAKLKQTLLLMDPAFNEANFGYSQFKSWLEANGDLINLYVKDLQLYVAPYDYNVSGDLGLSPMKVTEEPEDEVEMVPALETQYKELFSRKKLPLVDFSTRRDVLRDVYRELRESRGKLSFNDLLECLYERYESQELVRTKSSLRSIILMGYRQNAFEFNHGGNAFSSPVRLANGIDGEADFVRRAESDFVYAVVQAGYEVDFPGLSYMLLNDHDQADYVKSLTDDLMERGMISISGKRYRLPGKDAIPFRDAPALKVLVGDIESVSIPEGTDRSVEAAHRLAKTATVQRSQDFVASASNYRLACRLLWEAVDRNESGATLQDLRWFLASYASASAGKLSQVDRDYSGARPYYLAFFYLVHEDDPLWSRMRGLINPMLSYYWANAGRDLDLNTNSWNIGAVSPSQIAVTVATHSNGELRKRWEELTRDLAEVNPGLLSRITDQLLLVSTETPEAVEVMDKINHILDKK